MKWEELKKLLCVDDNGDYRIDLKTKKIQCLGIFGWENTGIRILNSEFEKYYWNSREWKSLGIRISDEGEFQQRDLFGWKPIGIKIINKRIFEMDESGCYKYTGVKIGIFGIIEKENLENRMSLISK